MSDPALNRAKRRALTLIALFGFGRLRQFVRWYRATHPVRTAVARLAIHDGLEIAGSMAFSTLLSLFPFLIFLFALASFFDLEAAARDAISLSLGAFPAEIATALVERFGEAVSVKRPDLLTLGGVLAIWSASNGVESLRMGLNRAYEEKETRNILVRRSQSLGVVLVAAALALFLAYMTIVSTVIWAQLPDYATEAGRILFDNIVMHYAIAGAALLLALTLAHLSLPAGKRGWRDVLPGVTVSTIIWLGLAAGFSWYLSHYGSYQTIYGGLGGVAAAMVFFWFTAASILFGAELNKAIVRARD
jgi:membrane protein